MPYEHDPTWYAPTNHATTVFDSVHDFFRVAYQNPKLIDAVVNQKEFDRLNDSARSERDHLLDEVTRRPYIPSKEFGDKYPSTFDGLALVRTKRFLADECHQDTFCPKDSTDPRLKQVLPELTLFELYQNFDALHNPMNGKALTLSELKDKPCTAGSIEQFVLQNAVNNFDKLSSSLGHEGITKESLAKGMRMYAGLEHRAQGLMDRITTNQNPENVDLLQLLGKRFDDIRIDKTKPYISQADLKYYIAHNCTDATERDKLSDVEAHFDRFTQYDPASGDPVIKAMSSNEEGITRGGILTGLRHAEAMRVQAKQARTDLDLTAAQLQQFPDVKPRTHRVKHDWKFP